MMKHVPAAVINAIAEEGTKADAVEYLQKKWNELCAAKAALQAERDRADRNLELALKAEAQCDALAALVEKMRELLQEAGLLFAKIDGNHHSAEENAQIGMQICAAAKLLTAPTALAEHDAKIRREVVEECAKVADSHASIEGIAQKIAADIRALKTAGKE